MLNIEKLMVGIAGVGGRPKGFISAIEYSKFAKLSAVCDINAEEMDKAVEGMKNIKKYADYFEMIQKEDLDVVIIGTPMHLHVPQAVAALERNINVFSEVTAAVSLEQCKELVNACKKSKASYMMGENCNYMKPYMMVGEMVKAGIFGDVYYAEGEYLHNCRELAEVTLWRKKWGYGINGVTYGTHSLGPILSWFKGDRVTKVMCAGSGHHYTDSKGELYVQEDTCIMLAKTEKGRLIKIRQDISSNRPYNLKYILQGTQGCYDSARYKEERDLVWIEGLCQEEKWISLNELEDKYLPEIWQKYGQVAQKEGHDGSDFIIMTDYLDALINNRPVPISIHESLDMTLPGLISQESIKQGGIWLDVPNSREW